MTAYRCVLGVDWDRCIKRGHEYLCVNCSSAQRTKCQQRSDRRTPAVMDEIAAAARHNATALRQHDTKADR